MKNNMWKYESNDSQNISLHDHSIDKILREGNNILLVFDNGFDITKTHPLNDTHKSKHTTKSQIILKSARFISCVAYPLNQPQHAIDFPSLINSLCDFEILKFQIEDRKLHLSGNLSMSESKNSFAELVFSCSDVIFCWNDYSSDAWFEGWK